MAFWSSYHAPGEAGPKVQCLDDDGSTVLLDYTWTDVCAAALPDCDNVAPVMRDNFPLDEKIRVGLDGTKIVEVGGHYFYAKLEFKLLDKATAGEVQAVLNHCARGGQFKLKFFPHSDNTDIYFICHAKGYVGDLDVKGRPFAGGHSGWIEIRGLERFEERPWPRTITLILAKRGEWASYSAAEKENMMLCKRGEWASYSTSEKETDLGYTLKRSDVYMVS